MKTILLTILFTLLAYNAIGTAIYFYGNCKKNRVVHFHEVFYKVGIYLPLVFIGEAVIQLIPLLKNGYRYTWSIDYNGKKCWRWFSKREVEELKKRRRNKC